MSTETPTSISTTHSLNRNIAATHLLVRPNQSSKSANDHSNHYNHGDENMGNVSRFEIENEYERYGHGVAEKTVQRQRHRHLKYGIRKLRSKAKLRLMKMRRKFKHVNALRKYHAIKAPSSSGNSSEDSGLAFDVDPDEDRDADRDRDSLHSVDEVYSRVSLISHDCGDLHKKKIDGFPVFVGAVVFLIFVLTVVVVMQQVKDLTAGSTSTSGVKDNGPHVFVKV